MPDSHLGLELESVGIDYFGSTSKKPEETYEGIHEFWVEKMVCINLYTVTTISNVSIYSESSILRCVALSCLVLFVLVFVVSGDVDLRRW